VITVDMENGGREILISPFLLQSKTPPDLKSGKIEILYFYEQLRDADYMKMLEQDSTASRFKSDEFIINYGQDFEKYYLGSLHIDFDAKRYWQWEGKPNKLSKQDVNALGESLLNLPLKSRSVTLFTPTRPSDINLGRISFGKMDATNSDPELDDWDITLGDGLDDL